MSTVIPGNLHVANDVLADMVGNAALECYGVVGMAAPSAADGIAKILPTSRLRRGVVVTTTFALKEYARVPIDGVEVHVQGVKVRK